MWTLVPPEGYRMVSFFLSPTKRFALFFFFGSSEFPWFFCILGGPVTWEVQMVKPDDILVDFEGTNSLEDMRFLNIGGFSWLFFRLSEIGTSFFFEAVPFFVTDLTLSMSVIIIIILIILLLIIIIIIIILYTYYTDTIFSTRITPHTDLYISRPHHSASVIFVSAVSLGEVGPTRFSAWPSNLLQSIRSKELTTPWRSSYITPKKISSRWH